MDDLISRKAAIEAFDRIPLPRIKGLGLELLISVSDAKGVLEGMKAVDAAPVKHGKWIENEGFDGDCYYTCSVCHCDWTTIDGTPTENNMRYCPECGAKMDLEE